MKFEEIHMHSHTRSNTDGPNIFGAQNDIESKRERYGENENRAK